MRRRIVAGLLLAVPAFALAAPASAAVVDRHCYTPHAGPFPTYQVCYYLPGVG